MANTGLLILTNPARVRKLMPVIQRHVLKTLYIQYFPEKNISIPENYNIVMSHQRNLQYSKNIVDIYVHTSAIVSRLDIRVLLTNIKYPTTSVIKTKKPVEIVIFDQLYTKEETNAFIDRLTNKAPIYKLITYNDDQNQSCKVVHKNKEYTTEDMLKIYKNVVLGGTFDRLHNAHKILLSEAVLRCTEKLTVGVTETSMLSGKLLWELIEPCPQRIDKVKDFLEDVDSSIIYNVVPIDDIYGPTKEDPTFEMIVVSEETKRGGDKVNELRLQKNLNKLDIYVVELAIDECHNEYEEAKISSANQRIRLLGTRLKQPKTDHKPLKPYIIGLTGGIASGKSSVAEKLQKLSAGLINCDKIAHDLYLPGKNCFNRIIEHFGSSVLNSDGFIDRKKLGDVVFNDKEQLCKLNELIWPLILQETKKEIDVLYSKGYKIIVLEAAILIQAKWQNVCHEIWSCIIPQNEAIKRIMKRNGLTEEAAKLRIKMQPSNVEQVKEANVVLSTLWSHEVTQKQVEKAWKELTSAFCEKKSDEEK